MKIDNSKNTIAHTFSPVNIVDGTYLDLLKKIELRLPLLLKNESLWSSVDVDYSTPRVERLWFQDVDCRICLHRIHPVDHFNKTLLHPHPWPSAMKVLGGTYQMGVGYSDSTNQPLSFAATLELTENSTYEMINPNGWHYVYPLEKVVYSIMISGKPWPNRDKESGLNLLPLSNEAKKSMLEFFRNIYI